MWWAISLGLLTQASPSGPGPEDANAERRAIAYLAREVPRWSAENRCFSCHNNGDGARALLLASSLKRELPGGVLDDTLRWLSEPERWDHNGGDGPFSDKRLARVQFAVALQAAVEAGRIRDRAPLARAAAELAADQAEDGSWTIDGDAAGALGSPATYGRTLATALARSVLASADAKGHADRIARAARWLESRPVKSIFDSSAILIGLDGVATSEARAKARECFDLIARSQGEDGGWGPFRNSSSEVFDTALALIALHRSGFDREAGPSIRRGRAFLRDTQREDGSWTETTRPAGAESYAQRLSTTGWATLALLTTSAGGRMK